MRLAFGNDQLWAIWTAQRIPHAGSGFGPDAVTIGVVDKHEMPVGCVVFNSYVPHPAGGNIMVSFASEKRNWLTRNLISDILRYPFSQLGCGRITALVPPSATNATQFLEKMGWKREGCIRLGYGDQDAVVWGLLASEWRWNRFNVDRSVERPKKRRRRRRGTLHLREGAPLH